MDRRSESVWACELKGQSPACWIHHEPAGPSFGSLAACLGWQTFSLNALPCTRIVTDLITNGDGEVTVVKALNKETGAPTTGPANQCH